MMELDVFTREESIEFQRRRMRRFSAAGAHRLAEAVGDLPLLLEHAAESGALISKYISALNRDPLGLLNGQPSDYFASIAHEWGTILDHLRAREPDALNLLGCLCFFGSEPIPREALERGSHLSDVSIRGMLREPIRLTKAILILRRVGLLRLDADARTLEVHQITRYIVQDMASRSHRAYKQRWRHDVHLLLSAADPLDPNEPANWRSYEELRGHAIASSLEACGEQAVRDLVVNLARFLNASGDPEAALTLADSALQRWAINDDSALMMRQAKSDALLARGRLAEAFQLQQETLSTMRSDPEKWEAEIIRLNTMSGVRCRMAGKFQEAAAADAASRQEHVAMFGADHPDMFVAIDHMITDLALVGQYGEAIREAELVYNNCRIFYNTARNPAVLFQRNAFARCLRLNGKYRDAVAVITEVREGYDAAVGDGMLDEDHPWCLASEVDYAAARRDAGLLDGDLEALANGMQDVHRRCWRKLGIGHHQTVAAAVVLGSILWRIPSQRNRAVQVITDAEQCYRTSLPGHPYCLASKGLLAAMRGRRGTGDLAAVVTALAGEVGESHPLTLTAQVAHANLLADAGEFDDAVQRHSAALEEFRATLGADHPHTLACEANIVTIRSRLGHAADPADLMTRFAAAVGADHPDVRLLAEHELIFIDFTPLPL
jgi:tetratricopeptide (TPR) repeat protein